MSSKDARFEDVTPGDRPLRLKAETQADLDVLSSLAQDAVGKAGEIAWLPRKRRLVAVVNRFRWEAGETASGARPRERVRSALTVEGVLKVRARGITPSEREQVYELLAIRFDPDEDGAGNLTLTLAGGAEIAVEVECLELTLADISQPWQAVSGKEPEHDL